MKKRAYIISYIQSIKLPIAILIVLCLMLYFVLHACNVSTGIIYLVILCIVFAQLMQFIFCFIKDYGFWKNLAQSLECPLRKSKTLSKPSGARANIAFDYIEALGLESQEALNKLMLTNSEYQEFIESWVHEIKTPLSAASLIVANHPSDISGALGYELDKTKTYVDQALYYARLGSVERDLSFRKVKLEDIVTSAIKSRMHMLIEANVKVGMDNLDQVVVCDSKWIEFIVGQIIDNAVKYADVDKSQPEINFSSDIKNKGTAHEVVYLKIKDNGIGISDKDISRIFDKGFVGSNGRGQMNQKSTGIGLYLVAEMCKKMSVKVHCKSKPYIFTEVSLGFQNLTD